MTPTAGPCYTGTMDTLLLTHQEIYDRTKAHLVAQGRKAITMAPGYATCAYRAPDGASCAVGCHIRDEDYGSHFEGIAVAFLDDSLIVHRRFTAVLCRAGIDVKNKDTRELVAYLQRAHDGADDGNFTDDIVRRLVDVAERFGLRP